MNKEEQIDLEKAAYHLSQNPKSLISLLEDCIQQEIIGILEDNIPYWYHTGEDLTD
jgi:hypothetical protein